MIKNTAGRKPKPKEEIYRKFSITTPPEIYEKLLEEAKENSDTISGYIKRALINSFKIKKK